MVINSDKALQNPSIYYRSPQDVMLDQDLNDRQKIQLLKQWEYDERELAVAEEENMTGGPPSRLDEILQVLHQLGEVTGFGPSPPTKQGGH